MNVHKQLAVMFLFLICANNCIKEDVSDKVWNLVSRGISLGNNVHGLYHLLAVGMEEKAVTAIMQSE